MEDKLLEELYASYNGDAYAAHLKGMVEKYGDLQVAEMIVNQFEDRQKPVGNTDVIEFQTNYHMCWKKLKIEFDKLVCGQKPYEKENQEYYVLGKFFSLATASSMAHSISPIVGIPHNILTPTIVLMLHSVLKMGRNVYCNAIS